MHVLDQAAVVHVAAQVIIAGIDGVLGMEEQTAEAEKAAVVDKARVLQLFGHIAHAVALVHGDLDLHIVLVQRTQVVEQQPADTGQQTGAQHHAGHVQRHMPSAALALLLFLLGAAGRALAAHLLGVVVGGLVIVVSILGHSC